jgi:hypothetical protein
MKTADAPSGGGPDPVIWAWDELKRHLEQRGKELSAEVRRYPTPIGHCDDQLPKLIAQRDHAMRQLRLMAEVDSAPSGVGAEQSFEALVQYLSASAADPDDETEIAIRSRLEEAAARRRKE